MGILQKQIYYDYYIIYIFVILHTIFTFKTIGVHNLEILHFKFQVMKTYEYLFQVAKNISKMELI